MNKILFLFLLFTIWLHAAAQTNIPLKLTSVKGRDTRYSNIEFELYQKDSLISSAYFSPVFKNVASGTYTIQFFNIYEIKEVIPFNTDTLTNDSIEVYIDRIDYNSIKINSFVDRIKKNKPFTINMHSAGCFTHAADTLIIKNENNSYVLYYNAYKKILSPTDLNMIRDFEKELRILPDDVYCTTKASYTLAAGNKKRRFMDETCSWHGLTYLKKNLNLEPYEIFNQGTW